MSEPISEEELQSMAEATAGSGVLPRAAAEIRRLRAELQRHTDARMERMDAMEGRDVLADAMQSGEVEIRDGGLHGRRLDVARTYRHPEDGTLQVVLALAPQPADSADVQCDRCGEKPKPFGPHWRVTGEMNGPHGPWEHRCLEADPWRVIPFPQPAEPALQGIADMLANQVQLDPDTKRALADRWSMYEDAAEPAGGEAKCVCGPGVICLMHFEQYRVKGSLSLDLPAESPARPLDPRPAAEGPCMKSHGHSTPTTVAECEAQGKALAKSVRDHHERTMMHISNNAFVAEGPIKLPVSVAKLAGDPWYAIVDRDGRCIAHECYGDLPEVEWIAAALNASAPPPAAVEERLQEEVKRWKERAAQNWRAWIDRGKELDALQQQLAEKTAEIAAAKEALACPVDGFGVPRDCSLQEQVDFTNGQWGILQKRLEALQSRLQPAPAAPASADGERIERLHIAIECLVADEVISSGKAREMHCLSIEDQRALWRKHPGDLYFVTEDGRPRHLVEAIKEVEALQAARAARAKAPSHG